MSSKFSSAYEAPAASGERVVVGMSGGVDSSVAALRLLEAGYAVEGLFMKNWEEDDGTAYCTAHADLADARAVCEQLGIALHTANFAAEYWDAVFERFLAEYGAGRTPNPDVLCNREIKFNVFIEYAQYLGADWIATGHYARLRRTPGGTELLKGVDLQKDQSYFLHAVSSTQLAHALFPLGELTKHEVRARAADAGFHNHAKKDSTGICFIGERRFSEFLARYITGAPGPIANIDDGRELATHAGLAYYTIGQRKGLGIGGVRAWAEAPWYVADKDPSSNTLWVAQGASHPALFGQWLVAEDEHWIGAPPPLPHACNARIRYRQPEQRCRIAREGDGRLWVTFARPQRAIAPGQWVCFYDAAEGEVCLGGAVIAARATPLARTAPSAEPLWSAE